MSDDGKIIESVTQSAYFGPDPVNPDGEEWIITRDLLCEEFGADPDDGFEDETNTRSLGWSAVADKLEVTYAFRLYDDDGILYYEGVCTTDDSFGPLMWAQANAGATRIDYRQADGTWATL